VVEVDGGYHAQRVALDARRQRVVGTCGVSGCGGRVRWCSRVRSWERRPSYELQSPSTARPEVAVVPEPKALTDETPAP
jgi:hypothetical protein